MRAGAAPGDGYWEWWGPEPLANVQLFGATVLADGRVLTAGGFDLGGAAIARTQIYDPASHTWTRTGDMARARVEFPLVTLADGRVLAIGGAEADRVTRTADVEVFDPATGTWSPTGSLHGARSDARAALLANGLVLVVGGRPAANVTLQCELYDPQTGTWANAGGVGTAYEHRVVALSDGRAFISGPGTGNPVFVPAGFDAGGQRFVSTTGGFGYASHSATLMAGDRVLLTGGHPFNAGSGLTYPNSFVFDPTNNSIAAQGSMATARRSHEGILLPDGRVMIVGGWRKWLDSPPDRYESLASTEVFDPMTGLFSPGPPLNEERFDHRVLPLPGGQALLVGGRNNGSLDHFEILGAGCAAHNGGCDEATTCTESDESIVCGACPADTLSGDGTGADACTPCEDGTTSMAGATSCAPVGSDAGTGTGDGGTASDAGGSSDSGMVDVGGGVTDASLADGGTAPRSGGGCGCRTSADVNGPVAPLGWVGLLVGLALHMRRRRAKLARRSSAARAE